VSTRKIVRRRMIRLARAGIALSVIFPAIAVLNAGTTGGSCESLASLNLPGATITAVQSVAAGAFELSGSGRPGAFKDLPGFCRVAATLKPTNDSDIKVEVWLPGAGWNGKYQAVGNPGWAGSINYSDLAQALKRGYAASSTDTGHTGASGSFALGHPEKLIDFGYRSEHEMTVHAKAIIAAFYGNAPKLSYFVGCSSGGRQALMEAQRFPGDYDGIVAGAPTNNWTNMMFGRIWVAQAALKEAASYIPPAKYPVIHKAALEACDALDGVKDGIIGDPPQCHFDPKVLECKQSDAPDCLTTPQVEAARKIYASAKNPRTGQAIFPGMEPGSELVWATLAGGPKPIALADDHFKYVVFQDANWDFKTLNFDGDLTRAEKADDGILSATNPDLRPFVSHGGKLIQYHGWTDQQVQPLNSVNYYNSAVKALGGPAKAMDSYRLFMVPGMNHCGGGDGPNSFDMAGALDQWVETGKAPDRIVASHGANGKVDRTRPLCPYPQVARYSGSGSTDEAANFACVENK
jgi:feruloyl esterase